MIWFYYWIFPSLLPRLQRYTTQQKQKWLIGHFVIQLLVPIVLIVGGGLVSEDVGSIGGLASYYWPVVRLPQFIMGVLAGLLRNEGLGMRAGHSNWTTKQWSKCSNIMGALLVVGLVVLSVIVNVLRMETVDIAVFLLQYAVAWWAMEFIISLTFEGDSFVSKLLTSKVALSLGRISYGVYLIHIPVHLYLSYAIHGAVNYAELEFVIPMWCVPVMWIISVILGILLNRFIDEPLRKMLRPSRVEQAGKET